MLSRDFTTKKADSRSTRRALDQEAFQCRRRDRPGDPGGCPETIRAEGARGGGSVAHALESRPRTAERLGVRRQAPGGRMAPLCLYCRPTTNRAAGGARVFLEA